MFWVMINISNVLIQSKESVHANHACTRERERERERVCYIVLRVLTSITKLLAYCFQKKSLLLPANASRSVDLPQPEGPIIARSSPGRA